MNRLIAIFLLIPMFLPGQSEQGRSYIDGFTAMENDTFMIDSIYNLVWAIKREDPESSKELLDFVERYQEENNFDYRADVKWYYRSLIYKGESNFEKSESNLLQYLAYNTEKNDTIRMSFANQALCNLYYDFRHLQKSMKAAYRVLELKKNNLDTTTYLVVNSRISSINSDLGNYDEALKLLKETVAVAKKYGSSDFISNLVGDLGLLYKKMEVKDSMLYYLQEAKRIAIEGGDGHQELYARFNLAAALNEVEDYEASIEELKIAQDLSKTYNDKTMEKLCYVHLASGYLGEGNVSAALRELKNIDPSDKNLNFSTVKDYYLMRSEAEAKNNNYAVALDAYKKYKSYADSIVNEDVARQINEIKVQYETDLKEQKIASLDQENKIIELKLQSANREKLFTYGGLIVLAIILFLLYNYTQTISRNRKELSQKNAIISKALNEKETLLREIHHRVKNNLQVISSLLSIQGRNIKDHHAKEAIKESRNRVKSMALIHQNLYQEDNLIGTKADTYISRLSDSLFRSYNISADKVKLTLDIDPINLDVDKIIPLGLILNELITNALKYAFEGVEKGILNIQLKDQQENLSLKITDNGNGMPDGFNIEEDGNMGFQLIRALATKLEATIKVPDVTSGTQFIISLPKTNGDV